MYASKPATLIYHQNPQDCVPYFPSKRPITINPPIIDESFSSDPLPDDHFQDSKAGETEEAKIEEEEDEVTQLFLRVQAECRMSKLVIRPMLEEIEEEQTRMEREKGREEGKRDVKIQNTEKREVTESCVITFRSMGPINLIKQKTARKKSSKQKKKLRQHPERVQLLFLQVLELKKITDRIRDLQLKGWKSKHSNMMENKLKVMKSVCNRQEKEEMERKVKEMESGFPEEIKRNIERFVGEERERLEGSEDLEAIKRTLFPGLIPPTVKETLSSYRASVEFPYTSHFDSRAILSLLQQRWTALR